ncbi:MAG TPA: hypothetical protein VJN18_21740 [Polyangiaceae bacterium]|nr:hypothetical protein [Polyangiaceae bacterium]
MKRRRFLIEVPACALLLACSSAREHGPVISPYSEIAVSAPKAGEPRTILVFMPRTPQALEVWTGLRDELARDFKLVAVEVEGRDSVDVFMQAMRRHRASAIVLMNNPTLAAYREYQALVDVKRFPPAIVVMTSFLMRRPNAIASTGISYEVPLITAVTNMRKLMAKPIHRVGIVVRSNLRGFVEQQLKIAARERVVARLEQVSATPNAAEIKRALRIVKQNADAVWVLNDDHLLSPRLIAEGWLPGMNERPWVPAIVGVASLVAPGTNFGTFAVLPDHTALGTQTANMILDLADNDWRLNADMDVQLPLSTVATIDLVQAEERFALRPDALQRVDRVLR